jgi:hypothetical protein
MRKRLLGLIVFLLPLLAVSADAATANTAVLTWTAPTLNTDGTTITLPLTYNVYQGASGSTAKSKVQSGITALAATVTAGLVAGTTACFELTAVAGALESAHTAEVCKAFPSATPNAPGNLQISVTVASTIYKLRQSVDGYSFVAIGTAPLGTACDASHNADGYSPVPRASVHLASRFDTLPLIVFAQCG